MREADVAALERAQPLPPLRNEPGHRPEPSSYSGRFSLVAHERDADGALQHEQRLRHLGQPPAPAPSPSSTAPGPQQTVPPDLVAAAEWRNKAFAACDDGRWSECLASLDQARALDPAGDSSPLAKSARERAILGMQQKPDKPPVPRPPQSPDKQPLK